MDMIQTANGPSMTEATISNLTSSTNYSIQVAAETSAGTGNYSSAVNQLTNGVCVHYLRCGAHSLCFSQSLLQL